MGTPARISVLSCLVNRINSGNLTVVSFSCSSVSKKPIPDFDASVIFCGIYPRATSALVAPSAESASMAPDTELPFSVIAW